MKINFDTLILFTHNIDKVKFFYIDNFNFEIIEEISTEWILLKAGNCNLGLHQIGKEYINENQEEFRSDNNIKMVFEIDDDIYSFRKELISKGVILNDVKNWENYPYLICDGEDLEGNKFQLRQNK